MITVSHLHKRMGTELVLRGIDLEVERRQIVAVVGPSGSGKSTLLKHVVGLTLPDAGDVCVGGRSVCHAGERELARLRRRMGYAFQNGALLDSLTIRENLRLALDDSECVLDPGHEARRIGESLELVQLGPDVLDKHPVELSGGMHKRVGVARAILNRPELLLFDEPTSGLDPLNVRGIHGLVVNARDHYGATAIVVTHDLSALPGFADRVVLLLDGRVYLDAAPDDLFASCDPRVRSFFGEGPRTHAEVMA